MRFSDAVLRDMTKGTHDTKACQCDQEWKQRNLQEMQTSVSGGLMWMQS